MVRYRFLFHHDLCSPNILPWVIRRPRPSAIAQALAYPPSKSAISFSCPVQSIDSVPHAIPPQTFTPLCAEPTSYPLSPLLSAYFPRALPTPLAWTFEPKRLRPSSPLRTCSRGFLRVGCRAEAKVRICGYRWARTVRGAEDNDAHLTRSKSVGQSDLVLWRC
ncbi:hypothetical protein CC86DRAFT_12627 [Ophiobolus disseminans]|uniref:Uncharacterized protein n=1 Tax=Ophiobolus disseminans TaxID=1469910 RepID=A0A6A7AK73_9PLEO|nr:hypothetical protein CC86DRAFT_12627 [Ophiobolus disseminans]